MRIKIICLYFLPPVSDVQMNAYFLLDNELKVPKSSPKTSKRAKTPQRYVNYLGLTCEIIFVKIGPNKKAFKIFLNM